MYECSDDTFLLWETVANAVQDFSQIKFLDMGAGSGYLGGEAQKVGCKSVTLVDVMPESISYMNDHFSNCKIIHSDLFENVPETFDIMVFNTPYLPNEDGIHDIALHGGPEGITVARRFLHQARFHLSDKGRIFLLVSSLGNIDALRLQAQSLGFQLTTVAKKNLFFETLLVIECIKNDHAFDMRNESDVKSLKELLPDVFTDNYLLHRGKRGVIFQGKYDGLSAVAKVARPDAGPQNTLLLESTYLQKANALSIGPRLLVYTPSYVIMEFIDGVLIGNYLQNATASQTRSVLTAVFEQLRALDSAGLNKHELTNPYKHIIVRNDSPVLIDFERMRFSSRTKNVTQFAQYISNNNMLPVLQQKGVLVQIQDFMSAIKSYAEGEEVAFEQYL